MIKGKILAIITTVLIISACGNKIASKEVKNINLAIHGVRSAFAAQGSYVGLNNTVAIAMQIVPKEWLGSLGKGTIKNLWGGDVIYKPEGQSFAITLYNVPSGDICFDLIHPLAQESGGESSAAKIGNNKFSLIGKGVEANLKRNCETTGHIAVTLFY